MITDLIAYLKKHCNCFAWGMMNMPRIDPKIITHNLNIGQDYKPINKEIYLKWFNLRSPLSKLVSKYSGRHKE